MTIGNNRFRKQERIVSRRLVEALFGGVDSRSMAAYPVRAVYTQRERADGDVPVQILVSVPKKHFHHAVDRNRVKRQLREAYRLEKHVLWSAVPAGCQLLVAFVWLSPQHLPTADVARRVTSLLRRIAEKVSVSHEACSKAHETSGGTHEASGGTHAAYSENSD